MHFKIFNYRQKSEEGFILIAAIMAVMIMLAVSFFILTTSSQDILMSSRLVGERKAISAAESGVEAIYGSVTPVTSMVSNPTPTPVDSAKDPSLSYTSQIWLTNQQVQLPGYDPSDMPPVYKIQVIGNDSKYGSSETISIGVAPPPSGSSTTQYKTGL
jgi:hypothetical protein